MVWSIYIFKGVFTVQSWDPHTQIFIPALRDCRRAVKDHLRLGHCGVLLTFSWPYCGQCKR